jgi:class 3 adenylate cyclase
VVSDAVADGVTDDAIRFEAMESVPLKGIAHPVTLFLASRGGSPSA